ncbi:protein-glutamate methylesterase/protein-glutamine glutaminase [Anatilimnocola floriformis]|uniref:protein-glutamate methylesterase/protein-glutamine glutaminase n=1 Tax=Anatilimnocola floriformis TaxID=2948575 RepID=UPI0020C47183|nr:chemotaxis response regulator protein-glutamate methylesterase [Anatilimnocola floriformis]
MRKIRVLVVDDSIVIRRLLTEALSSDPEIELAGTAPNGRIALAKLPQLNPDLVTLDIEMPDLDGLGTLPELRKNFPKLPVIMFSTLTARGAIATLDSLARGATDYVTKPANVGSVAAGIQSVKDQLIPKIKALCAPPVASKAAAPKITCRPASKGLQRTDAIVIGSSTGGPQALANVLCSLPQNLPVPIVVVQHMPPVFTNHLANRLNQEGSLEVREARNGDLVQPGLVLIAPGNYHVQLQRVGTQVRVVTQQESPENSCRPAVDVLFRSAAEVYGGNCLGVVLTGMGQDGLRGAREIVDHGGNVLAQNEDTCVVWGMPRAVVEAGLANKVLPLDEISGALEEAAFRGRVVRATAGAAR